jgi:hypothetical protein
MTTQLRFICNITGDVVNNIYEVLLDFDNSYNRDLVKPGISLIIRAKNEELNIKYLSKF